MASLYGLLLLVGCGENNNPGSQRRGGGGTVVEIVVLRPQAIDNTIVTTGSLMANEEVVLRPEMSGRVTGLYFNEGQAVKAGALLVQINNQELLAEQRRKQYEEKLASDEERRAKSLLSIKGISQEEYDKSLNRLNMITAEREVVESQLAQTEIRAPFDGVVGLRHISVGGVVTTGTVIATMQDTDPMKVEFSVPEKYAGKLVRGTAVMLGIGEAQAQYRGSVYAIESKVDPTTRTLKVRATVPNPSGTLIPGSFAKVDITLERLTDAVVVPAEAIVPDLAGDNVFLFQGGKARKVPVGTGIRTERSVQITNGLTAGDTLIVTGLLQIEDGKAVQLKGTAPAKPAGA